ncbi:MAG: hypothetical protein LH469_00160, partial [Frankiaceae bacterium]|nr:hypothetical protein [Frankiaceae bacterium]
VQAVCGGARPGGAGGDIARGQAARGGGATARAGAALLPASPWGPAHRAARVAVRELAAVLRDTAAALREQDTASAAFALTRARATSPALAAWGEALLTGRDITRLSPLRRDTGHVWEGQSRTAAGVDRATSNVRVLVRRVLFALGEGDPLPPSLPGLLEELAEAVDLMAEDVAGEQDRALRALTELAGVLDPAALRGGLSSSVVVGQLRAAVVDLLEAVGVAPDRARAALPRSG